MLENLQPEQGNAKKSNFTGLIIFVLIVVILGLAWYFLMVKGQKPVAIAPQVPAQDQTKQEVQSLVASVGKLMVLPSEEPLVATIDDPAALQKEQPFYAGSEKGDKLLIFFQARKAVIYNPARNVIVNAGPIIMQQDQAAVQPPSAEKKK
jgi:hypothetical protein